MTESEVNTIDDCINELRKHRNVYLKRSTPWRVVNRALHLIEQYRAIGTVEELKALRNASELWEHNNNLAYKQGRIDAIDEFVKEIEAEYDNDGCPNVSDYLDYKISIRDLQKIAEQMKGGATDERTGSN